PKLLRARQALRERLDAPRAEDLMALLADSTPAPDTQLPDTGVGLETERLLSSVFIRGGHYGTRASSALIARDDGRREFHERRFGPDGARLGEVRLALKGGYAQLLWNSLWTSCWRTPATHQPGGLALAGRFSAPRPGFSTVAGDEPVDNLLSVGACPPGACVLHKTF